jgi:mono/diheme cytochrome c family protein
LRALAVAAIAGSELSGREGAEVRLRTWQGLLLAVSVLVLVAVALLHGKLAELRVDVPDYRRPPEVVRLDQNWTEAQRKRFHHTPQGTRLVPYEWLKALEQPCFSPLGCGLFTDPAYLDRFGFIPSEPDPELNPDGLPVGFAVDRDFVDPVSHKAYPVVGLNCAACHTNELYYGKYAVQVEGAPATIEVTAFQKALGLALVFNAKLPFSIGRYSRFERRVLGANATDEQKAALKSAYDAFLDAALAEKKVTSERHIYDNVAGFRRTDALTRIGNQVFAADTGIAANYAVSNAPARFPQIWDASWLDWVQYNSSIADPLVRNIGEALGVRAVVKLHGPDALQFENSVNVRGLRTLEELLAGPGPLKGLSSPRWPSVFPALDQQKVARGAALYERHCQQCHLPPRQELLADLEAFADKKGPEPRYWWRNGLGNWFIKVTDVDLETIGTDPHEARDFKDRKADTGDLKKGVVSARAGLDLVTRGIATRFFEKNDIPPDERAGWAGGRDPGDPGVRDDLIYKARPLNGIWAVAPFLHNGSVPNLYLLLSPKSDRPATFWVGSKEFDPVKVGYDAAEMKGASFFDTSKPGNSNSGHEFKDGPIGNGVIGPLLSPDDRMAIIEYLKSL